MSSSSTLSVFTFFSSFPPELVLETAGYLETPDLLAFFLTDRRHSILLTPLLDRHAVQDRDELDALSWAAYRGHISLARRLLARGFDPNHFHPQQPPPLNFAARNGDSALLELLLDHGADLNIADEVTGYTALHEALSCQAWESAIKRVNSVKCVCVLLERGADPTSVATSTYLDPLEFAVKWALRTGD